VKAVEENQKLTREFGKAKVEIKDISLQLKSASEMSDERLK
jgi:hypothetical protein